MVDEKADARINTDVKFVSTVIQGGYESFVEKNSRMMNHLGMDISRFQAVIDRLQSVDIPAGYLPDDETDVIKDLDEINEKVSANLKILKDTIDGMSTTAKAALEAAGFMRLTNVQSSVKTYPKR